MGFKFLGNLLSENCKITRVSSAQGGATSAVNSASVDMAGFRGVMFVASLGTPAADNIMNAAQSADDSSFADLEGSAVDVGTSDDVQWSDIYDPTYRYVGVEFVRGTSSTIEAVYAIQYDPRDLPVSNVTSGTINGVALVNPDEGTA